MNQTIKSRSSQVNQKFLIKRILLYIIQDQNQLLMKKLALLARVTSIFYNIDGKPLKLKDSQCFKCKEKVQNKLIYLLHLELVHNQEINISKYEFSNDRLTIHIQQKQASNIPQFVVQIQDNKLMLLDALQNRFKNILHKIIKKFKKNQEKLKKRKYYHSIDIFKQVGSSSEDVDSQNQIGYIERDLEKNRIGQFVDVNEHEKLLFQIWNDLVHESKKVNKLISHQQIKQILMKFAVIAKKKGLKRPNVLVHAWALWSFGKIIDQDILKCLYIFDNTQI